MVDIVYNAIQRPVANEPDQKDIYHVDRTPKDARLKRTEEDDPKKQGRQPKSANPFAMEDEALNEEMQPKKQGKGKYLDEHGNQRVDYYV